MEYLPLSFDLRQQRVALIGGGNIALRKARALLKAQAQLYVIAPELDEAFEKELYQYKVSSQLKHIQASFDDRVFDSNFVLIVSATNNAEVNEQVSRLAKQANIPVNVVDDSELSSVIFPAIVDRDPITIAISSAGKAPVLARMLKSGLEASLGPSLSQLAKQISEFRDQVANKFPDIDQRKAFWEKLLKSPQELISWSKPAEEFKLEIEALLKDDENEIYSGEVYLIGAGPGDPELLSFKALRLLQQADVVLYDRLVSGEIVDMCRKDAERIYVGKSRKEHSLPQEDINQLLVRLAKEGKRVCRLKGGDPFIFGRGGEEIEELSEHGISFQIVPGVTAASGCSTYAGIPLTHRDYAQSVTFVTGHRQSDPKYGLNWKALAAPDQTLVFYMGLHEIENITKNLLDAGVPKERSAALVQQGTQQNQRVICSTVGSLVEKVKANKVTAPTIIIVGEVVQLRNKLAWYERFSQI